MINNYKYSCAIQGGVQILMDPGRACPFCQGTRRVPIRRIGGRPALYCLSCKYIEDLQDETGLFPPHAPGR